MDFDTEIELNKPLGIVWAFLIDPANMHLWLGEVVRFEQKGGTKGLAGFRCRYFFSNGYVDQRIQTSDMHKKLVMTLENDSFNTNMKMVFNEQGGKTSIKIMSNTEIDVPGAAFAGNAIRSAIDTKMSTYLNRLQMAIEQQKTTP